MQGCCAHWGSVPRFQDQGGGETELQREGGGALLLAGAWGKGEGQAGGTESSIHNKGKLNNLQTSGLDLNFPELQGRSTGQPEC